MYACLGGCACCNSNWAVLCLNCCRYEILIVIIFDLCCNVFLYCNCSECKLLISFVSWKYIAVENFQLVCIFKGTDVATKNVHLLAFLVL